MTQKPRIDYPLMESMLSDGEPLIEIAAACRCSLSHVMSMRPILVRRGLEIPGYRPHSKRSKHEDGEEVPFANPVDRPRMSWERKSEDWTPEHKAAFLRGAEGRVYAGVAS